MSFKDTYQNLELIDRKGAKRALKSVAFDASSVYIPDCIAHEETQNGFLAIAAQETTEEHNKHALDVVKDSILTFFRKRTQQQPMLAIREAIVYANKQLYYAATHNPNLLGQRINCVIVLFREKQLFYSYIGDNNLFLKNERGIKRLTPGKSLTEEDELSEVDLINSSIYDMGMNVSIIDKPYSVKTGDQLLLCSDAFVKASDDFVQDVFGSERDIQEKGIEMLQFSDDKDVQKTSYSFLLVHFKLIGGEYTDTGSMEYMYGNFIGKIVDFVTSTLFLVILAVFIIIFIFMYVL